MARDIGRIMIQLDTSVLIEHLTGSPQSSSPLRAALETGERLGLSAIALYEWLRGDRRPEEVEAQERLFPSQVAVAFGPAEARVAADLYRLVGRARTREADIAIAACALVAEARLWTLNEKDFSDIPGLRLYRPRLQ